MGPPRDLSAAALHIVERDGPSSVPLLASASTEASPSSLSRKGCLRLTPHCHLRSLSPVRGSLSLAALLALPPSVKRGSRARFQAQGVFGVVARDGRLSSGGYPPSPSFPMSFSPVLPPTSAKPVQMLTVPSERLWSPSWGPGGPLTDWSSLPSSRGGFQPAECLAPCPCRFPGIFLALPDASGENALTCPSTATSHCCCPVLSASSRPDWQSLEDIDLPLHQHSLSVSIDEAVHHPLLPCPCPGPLDCSTSCWGLAEQGSHLLFWVSIFTTRRVPLLPEVLAGCATPQHLLLLP